jgi:Protein of unknown function (DUF551)
MSEWISVKDRLPGNDAEKVLTYSIHGWGYYVGWLETNMANKRIWCRFTDYLPYVTHWQPLPEPPKETQ